MVTFSFRSNAPFHHFPRWRLIIVWDLVDSLELVSKTEEHIRSNNNFLMSRDTKDLNIEVCT